MQLYWLKEYYRALEQEFSNKVYSSMENIREKVNEMEVDKYYANNKTNFSEAIKIPVDRLPNNIFSPLQTLLITKELLHSLKILLKRKIFRYLLRGQCRVNELVWR